MKTEVSYRFSWLNGQCRFLCWERSMSLFLFWKRVRNSTIVIAFIHAHSEQKKRKILSYFYGCYFFATLYRFFLHFIDIALFYLQHLLKKNPPANVFLFNENPVVNMFILIYTTLKSLEIHTNTHARSENLPTIIINHRSWYLSWFLC